MSTDEPPLINVASLMTGGHRSATSLHQVHEYLVSLTQPHPDLGRPGAICPFLRRALDERLIWFRLFPGAAPPLSEVAEVILNCRDVLLALAPQTGNDAKLKTVITVFPDVRAVDAPHIVDRVQRQLKADFVPLGLMVGQFHPLEDTPGLHNAQFRPLRSCVPMLAIRSMVPSDFNFVRDSPDLVKAYISNFGNAIPEKLRPAVREAARRFHLALPKEADHA